MDDTNTHYSVLAELLYQELQLTFPPSRFALSMVFMLSFKATGQISHSVTTHKILHNIGLHIETRYLVKERKWRWTPSPNLTRIEIDYNILWQKCQVFFIN